MQPLLRCKAKTNCRPKFILENLRKRNCSQLSSLVSACTFPVTGMILLHMAFIARVELSSHLCRHVCPCGVAPICPCRPHGILVLVLALVLVLVLVLDPFHGRQLLSLLFLSLFLSVFVLFRQAWRFSRDILVLVPLSLFA